MSIEKKQLFLFCYVDEYKMAGKKEKISPMWEALKKQGIDLEPPVSLKTNTYFGCGQRLIKPDMDLIAKRREMFDRICHNQISGKPASAERDLPTQASPDGQQSGSKSKKSKKKNGNHMVGTEW